VAVLRPLISANNTINASAGSNALIITDYADNLQRIGKIISALDQPSSTDIEIVHAAACRGGRPGAAGSAAGKRAARPLHRAHRPAGRGRFLGDRRRAQQFTDPARRQSGPAGRLARHHRQAWTVPADHGPRRRHVGGAPEERRCRAPGDGGARGLRGRGTGGSTGARAGTAAAQRSRRSNTAGARRRRPAGDSASVAAAAQPSTGGFIQADPATNSLVITAPEPLYKQVRALIDQLDTRRAQVYIESMIVEVSPSDAADFGFQWQGLLGQSGDTTGLIGGTNFGGAGRPSIIDINTSAAQGQVNLGAGLNIGLLRAYNGVVSLAAIARMLQTQSETNIVSTPNLITLDNEEAKIVVGENVPFITGQFSSTGGNTSTTQPLPDHRAQGRRHHAAHPAADRRRGRCA
jgi:general secretion pathway protein D